MFLANVIVAEVNLHKNFESIESFLVYCLNSTVSQWYFLQIWEISYKNIFSKACDKIVVQN